MLGSCALVGCDPPSPGAAPAAGSSRPAAASAASAPRIVSLSPALTRTIADLGAGAHVVGRTPWCDAVGGEVPVVGTMDERDLERIAGLEPNLITIQSAAPDAALAQLARQQGCALHAWHLDGVADVQRMVQELGGVLEAAGIAGAQARAQAILAEHAALVVDRIPTRRPTLLLFSTDPPAAFGSGTFPGDLWSAMGGTNAIATAGYPALTAEDVARLAPALTIVFGKGEPPAWLARATGGVVVALDAPALLEPSSRMLVEGPPALRRVAERAAGDLP